MNAYPSVNVFGEALTPCSFATLTGFYRNGCCDTGPQDRGVHTVCVVMSDEFLAFSKSRGNDLSTPRIEFQFPGLRAGDRWCLCAARWLEAYEAGKAPKVLLSATHQASLQIVPLELLQEYALEQ
ncbi:MAG: DUF2237 domain-containing protein [Bacteroidota bacterium]